MRYLLTQGANYKFYTAIVTIVVNRTFLTDET